MRTTQGKVVGLLCLLAVLVAWPTAGQTPAAPAPQKPDAKSPQEEYKALLERLKASDAAVDFGRMRQLQTELETYDPYKDYETDPFDVLKSGDFKKAKLVAGQILETNYLHVQAHIAAVHAADELGDAAAAAHHRYVAQGVIDSILKSGDGKTLETAYKVIAVDEEYALVRSQGLRVTEQSLLREGEHSYDVLTVLDPETRTSRDVYFNIDPVMRFLDKKFSP